MDARPMDPHPSPGEPIDRVLAENASLREELSEMRARLEELERLADSDTLTPLPNRRYFMRELTRVLRHAERYGLQAAVMYIDVNELKLINDREGHAAGDAALIHTAMLLRRELRATDVVARIGGDEFGLILDHLDQASALAKAERLADQLSREPLILGNRSIAIGVAIGFTMVRPGDDIDTVLMRADAQMYAAKAHGEHSRQFGLPLG